ncbi:MAG: NAD(P)H-hydrate dehydratase [Chromatiales bacterium]|nr:NAD(P)H-hydrate dehydratase [Chromatiales bacterium]
MSINILQTDKLPHALYRAEQVRALDRTAIEQFGISGLTLMERAGAVAFKLLLARWPAVRDITVLCGTGNNGGDGYVVARLALEQGLSVRVLQLGDEGRIQGDARSCAEAYRAAGGVVHPYQGIPHKTDLIIDGVLGTGLEREVAGAWGDALNAANQHPAPVLALDIPSGIHSDTGRVMGAAVKAAATITFIGLKQGLFTGDAPEYCGDVKFDALETPAAIYASQILAARRLDWSKLKEQLQPRSRIAHKGHFGHLLLIGGDYGYAGAIRLAGEAALRTGAGLVTVATRSEHAILMGATRPELMCRGVESAVALRELLAPFSAIAIGPGLGQSDWSRQMLAVALESSLPLVVDADALNLLCNNPIRQDNWVLTPHPGEAARLLDCSTAEVQQDRFSAITAIQSQFSGVCVLKGAGTLIKGPGQRPVGLCSQGNPGMASGGMGDVLTGIIAALIAQGFDLESAAETGVCLHAAAADKAALRGERGMLASDLIAELRTLVNPETDGV